MVGEADNKTLAARVTHLCEGALFDLFFKVKPLLFTLTI